jgi:hypothetical protein
MGSGTVPGALKIDAADMSTLPLRPSEIRQTEDIVFKVNSGRTDVHRFLQHTAHDVYIAETRRLGDRGTSL